MTDIPVPTLFEWAGGQVALERLTTTFYGHVHRDPLLAPVFAHMDEHHPQFVADFLGEVLGGPAHYSERRGGHPHMVSQHLARHLSETQRQRWVALLLQSADEVELPADPEFRSAFVAYIEWGTRLAVINSQDGVTPDANAPMPRWGCSGRTVSTGVMTAPVEVWQRGPVAGFAAELQPVVHALLQVSEEIEREASSLTHTELWARPGGVASVGFHLLHLQGSTDRLFTYARGEALAGKQREFLSAESSPLPESVTAAALVAATQAVISQLLQQLHAVEPSTYQDVRYVGRARVASTVWGLLFHAAEHASRHAGQLTTTARIVRAAGNSAQ